MDRATRNLGAYVGVPETRLAGLFLALRPIGASRWLVGTKKRALSLFQPEW
jgi:hypothetical protein